MLGASARVQLRRAIARPKRFTPRAGTSAMYTQTLVNSRGSLEGDEVHFVPTPAFRRTKPEDLATQWETLGYKPRALNGYMKYTHSGGRWNAGTLEPTPYILMHVCSGALQYAISCFEGLKAVAGCDGMIRIMNPTLNAKRMQQGARRLHIPEVPIEMFVEAVSEAVRQNAEFVPPYHCNTSMYIRPTLFASGEVLSVMALPQEFTFAVMVTPVGKLFAGEEGVDALVMEGYDRAAPFGTGAVKAAGNYAADLEPLRRAKDAGFCTTLYLDAKERRYVEEFSVCNFVGITKDGKYVTPVSDAILQSTTNKMLQQLAQDEGIEVERRPVDFDAEIETFAEVGMVGTAATVLRVRSVTRGDKVYKMKHLDVLSRLRSKFTAIQRGELPDKHGWMLEVCPVPMPSTANMPFVDAAPVIGAGRAAH